MFSYQSTYERLILRHIGRLPANGDGVPEFKVRKAELKLGFKIPDSLRVYYLLAGQLDELNQANNRLMRPEQLQLDESGLMFMEEEQDVVQWFIPRPELSRSDPQVWQLVNSAQPESYEEGMSVSQFLVAVFDWQAGFTSDPGA